MSLCLAPLVAKLPSGGLVLVGLALGDSDCSNLSIPKVFTKIDASVVAWINLNLGINVDVGVNAPAVINVPAPSKNTPQVHLAA